MNNKNKETFRTIIKNIKPVLREDGLFQTTRVIQSRQTGEIFVVEETKKGYHMC